MKLPVDRRYLEERERFALKLHCEDCALWDEALDRCAHGFPTVEHRAPRSETDAPVVFCKDFELV